MENRIKIRRLSPKSRLPRYETEGSAGMDVCAMLAEPVVILSGERTRIPTGFALEIPEGFEAQVRPRSGLAFKQGLTVLNAPGTIDSDYRGEVAIVLVNLGDQPVVINDGDRIAQLVFAPITRVQLEETDVLSETDRGIGGFGSTG
ncbi:MAG: dUTP diphosphatase [Treponema sp.]|jgi:dUTP pyrophosphatase|nr:dUTP diphosphatase [Treponema sp.]